MLFVICYTGFNFFNYTGGKKKKKSLLKRTSINFSLLDLVTSVFRHTSSVTPRYFSSILSLFFNSNLR